MNRTGSDISKQVKKTGEPVTTSPIYDDSMRKFLNLIGGGVIAISVFTIGFLAGKFWNGSMGTEASELFLLTGDRENKVVTELDFNLFWQVWDTLAAQYVDPDIPQEDMYYGAIKGMVAGIGDPATVYLTPEETEEYNKGNMGVFEGIGAELGYEDGILIVVTPLEGSPAQEAGLRPGDAIIKVDGEDVMGKSIYEVVGKIRGESGTTVTITVLHEGSSEQTDVDVTRGEITVPSVNFDGMEGENIAVIDIDRFTEESSSAWQSRWDSIIREVDAKDPDALIIDMRGNPGGFFNAAIWAAGDFLPKNTLVSQQEGRNGNLQDFTVQREGIFLDLPIVVLVDEGSASASEILAGALQHYDRVYIIGEKTYGKGTAQQIVDYTDGSSLHITTLKWLLPDGSWLNPENVIEPDEVVELSDEDFKEGNDPQLDRAVEYLNSL